MRWTPRALATGRQMFGVLFDPEHATDDQVADIEAELAAETDEDLFDPEPCLNCGQLHAGSHCATERDYDEERF